MKLLRFCIFIGILLLLVDLSIAKKKGKDSNEIDPSDTQSDEVEDSPKKSSKKSSKKKESEEVAEDANSPEDEDDFKYVCNKKEKNPICKCETDILNCEKATLDSPEVYVRDERFTVKIANFKNNHIKKLEKGTILPGIDWEVEVLDFSNNAISAIENKTFNPFENLKKLHLSSNLLKSVNNGYLTKKIGDSLHQLFLDNNQITKIPPTAFSELKELTKLVLDGNPGIKLDKKIFPTALANLQILSLDRCGISALDDNIFESLTSLEQLSLRNNPITSLPKAINAIPNLSALDLSGTEIAELDTNQITDDHNLTLIRMSDMPFLYGIDDCAFCGLPNLKTVDLSNNSHLYSINENAFGAITNEKDQKFRVANLTEFDISNCTFKFLPQKLFDWTKVTTLKIHGNPFNCTCDLAWLVNDKNIHFATNPKCAEPASLNGTFFSNATESVCDGKTSNSSGSSSVLWAFVLFLTVIGLVGGFLLYTRRVRVTNILYRPEVPQMGYSNLTTEQQHPSQHEHEDEEELQGDFQPRADATPV